MTRRVEVAVLGGGPAGLATAIATAAKGLEVAVVERFHAPIDKPCGEGLLPAGRRALLALGIEASALEGRDLRGVRYLDGDVVAEGRFSREPGLGVRRPVLHRALAELAEAAGASLSWGIVVRGIERTAGGAWRVATDGGVLEARWVVGADGLASPTRRWAGLEGSGAGRKRFGVRRHYRIEPWTDRVEVYWGESCEAYVTPVAGDLVGVAVLWSGSSGGFGHHLAQVPALEARLGSAPVASKDRGCGPLRRRARAVVKGGLALVGDAAGYVDALTGEGLGLAFLEARALASALAEEDLSLYAHAHRRIVWVPELLTRLVLLLTRRPRLRRRVLALLARDRDLFARLLAVQNGEASLAASGVPALARLGARALITSLPTADP